MVRRRVRRLGHQRDAFDIGKGLAVPGGDGRAPGDRRIHLAQLQQSEGRLHLVELAVDAWRHHCHFVGEAEILQEVDALLGLGVRADDGPTLDGVVDLGGVKTQHRQVTAVEQAAALVAHTKGMGSVVDHLQAVGVGNALDGPHVAGMAIAVHRHDRGGLGRDGRLDALGVEVAGVWINVGEHRLQAIPQQRVSGGDEGIRRGDHFALDAQGLQRRHQGDGAVGQQRQMFHPQVLGQRLFQLLVEGPAVGQDLAIPDHLQQLDEVFEGGQLGLRNVEVRVAAHDGLRFRGDRRKAPLRFRQLPCTPGQGGSDTASDQARRPQ